MKKLFIAITLISTTLFAGSQEEYREEERDSSALYQCANPAEDIKISFQFTSSYRIGGIWKDNYEQIVFNIGKTQFNHWLQSENGINFDIDYFPEYFHNINVKIDFDDNLINAAGEITKENLYIRFTSKPVNIFSDRMIILITDLTQKTTDAINLKCARKY